MKKVCAKHQNCIDSAMATAELICSKNGLQLTELRSKVLWLIWQSHQPAKAYELLDMLAEFGYSSKPPTVYRALDFLLENGLIHKIEHLNAFVGCSHAERGHACYLFVCEKCAEVTECCNADFEKALETLAHGFDFELTPTDIELKGVCRKCKLS